MLKVSQLTCKRALCHGRCIQHQSCRKAPGSRRLRKEPLTRRASSLPL